MNLKHQPGLRAFIRQAVPHPHHGKLDDVGRRPLDRHVEGDPFAEGARVEVGTLQLRQVPAPVPERPDTAGLLRGGDDVVHVLPHAAVAVEIGLHIGLGLGGAYPDILSQRKGRNPIDDAEVDRLGPAAQLVTDLFQGDIEDLGRGHRVEVLAREEGLLHIGIARDMGQQTQLNLAVVGVHQDLSRRRGKHRADLGAEFLAHRDVLQVRLGG